MILTLKSFAGADRSAANACYPSDLNVPRIYCGRITDDTRIRACCRASGWPSRRALP